MAHNTTQIILFLDLLKFSIFACMLFLGEGLSLKAILLHFAVETGQTKDNMNLLLRLLKKHKPEPCFDSLPSTALGLLFVSGADVTQFKIPRAVDSGDETDNQTDSAVNQNTEDPLIKKKKKRCRCLSP